MPRASSAARSRGSSVSGIPGYACGTLRVQRLRRRSGRGARVSGVSISASAECASRSQASARVARRFIAEEILRAFEERPHRCPPFDTRTRCGSMREAQAHQREPARRIDPYRTTSRMMSRMVCDRRSTSTTSRPTITRPYPAGAAGVGGVERLRQRYGRHLFRHALADEQRLAARDLLLSPRRGCRSGGRSCRSSAGRRR